MTRTNREEYTIYFPLSSFLSRAFSDSDALTFSVFKFPRSQLQLKCTFSYTKTLVDASQWNAKIEGKVSDCGFRPGDRVVTCVPASLHILQTHNLVRLAARRVKYGTSECHESVKHSGLRTKSN